MARGRMISKSVSTSESFAHLNDVAPTLVEFAQSLYLLLVAHADDFGRQQGDVFTIRHAVHPTSTRSDAEFSTALDALRDVGLIHWYVVDARRYVAICKFDEHQIGLHKRTRSAFPVPTPDARRSGSIAPDAPVSRQNENTTGTSRKFPTNRREEKRREEKGSTETAKIAVSVARARETPSTAIAPVWNANGRRGHGHALVGSHTACYPTAIACARGICLPSKLGAEWAHQFTDPADAEREITATVADAIAALGDGPVGDDPWQFWRAVWRHRHGSRAPSAGASRSGDTVTAARAYLREQILGDPKP